jgi:hypothetical protein
MYCDGAMVVYHVICTCLGIEFELSRCVFFHFHEFDRVAHFHCDVNLRLRRYYFLIYKKIKIYNFCRLTIADRNYYDNFRRPETDESYSLSAFFRRPRKADGR